MDNDKELEYKSFSNSIVIDLYHCIHISNNKTAIKMKRIPNRQSIAVLVNSKILTKQHFVNQLQI